MENFLWKLKFHSKDYNRKNISRSCSVSLDKNVNFLTTSKTKCARIKMSIKAILNYKFVYYVLASFPKHTYPIENLSVSFHRLSFAHKQQTCNYLMIIIEGFKFCLLSSKLCSLNYCMWLPSKHINHSSRTSATIPTNYRSWTGVTLTPPR